MGRAIKYRDLKRRYELEGAQATCEHLADALEQKHLKPEDFSIRDIAEACVEDGREWVRSMDPRHAGSSIVTEASDAVDVTAFSNITGQLVINKIMQAYENPAFVMSKLVQTVPTSLNGEKIPGIEPLKPQSATSGSPYEVHPGMPFQSLGFGEDYTETPATTKRGMIVPVTKEAIFFDRTNLVLSRAGEVGKLLGIDKESRLCKLVAGLTNNYKWKGTSYNTYLTSGAWINSVTGVELVDWTDVDELDQVFAGMRDPVTNLPIIIGGKHALVMPFKRATANRIMNATHVEHVDNTAAASTVRTQSQSPISGQTFDVSALLYDLIVASGVTAADAKKYWFYGDFNQAFGYMENWPITVVQAPQNSEAEFTQDIVARFKASERGVEAVLDPRYVVKATG